MKCFQSKEWFGRVESEAYADTKTPGVKPMLFCCFGESLFAARLNNSCLFSVQELRKYFKAALNRERVRTQASGGDVHRTSTCMY